MAIEGWRACARCRGTGSYYPECDMCSDSTYDHVCPDIAVCDRCGGDGLSRVVIDALTAARAEGYADGRASERADMLAFVEEACRLGTQGDALLRALMAKGRHEGAASIVAKKGTP